MILTDKMREALEILEAAPAAAAKISSADLRTVAHPTMARLILHHLAEETGGADLYRRPLRQITPAGREALERSRATSERTHP